jgi:hypothetical protein
MPNKTILLTNNGPAITTSSFLQLPNDSLTTSTGLQVSYNRHFILNDITSPQALFALTAIMAATMTQAPTTTTAITKATLKLKECFFTSPQAFFALTAITTVTMTQVPAITTAITKATIKLDECFLHPTKTGANNATIKSESLLLHA